MNILVAFLRRNAVEASIYITVNSQLSLSENTFPGHMFYILRYSGYSVYNVCLQLVRPSSCANTVSMHYIIMHYNDPLTNMETYMFVYVCTDICRYSTKYNMVGVILRLNLFDAQKNIVFCDPHKMQGNEINAERYLNHLRLPQ